MSGSARHCWIALPTVLTSWKLEPNRIDSAEHWRNVRRQNADCGITISDKTGDLKVDLMSERRVGSVVERSFPQRKKKNQKERKGGGLWKLPQLWKKQTLRCFSHSCLDKTERKTCSVLSTIST